MSKQRGDEGGVGKTGSVLQRHSKKAGESDLKRLKRRGRDTPARMLETHTSIAGRWREQKGVKGQLVEKVREAVASLAESCRGTAGICFPFLSEASVRGEGGRQAEVSNLCVGWFSRQGALLCACVCARSNG